jgi:hypothetical protein
VECQLREKAIHIPFELFSLSRTATFVATAGVGALIDIKPRRGYFAPQLIRGASCTPVDPRISYESDSYIAGSGSEWIGRKNHFGDFCGASSGKMPRGFLPF